MQDQKGKNVTPSIEKRLQDKGWEQIGSGGYASVYGHKEKPDIAVKISSYSDPWWKFAIWAAERGFAGKNAPLVHSIRFLGRIDKDYLTAKEHHCGPVLAFTERLYPQINHYYDYNSAQWWNIFSPDFSTACITSGWRDDIKATNVLQRKDGTMVLNDPLNTQYPINTYPMIPGTVWRPAMVVPTWQNASQKAA
jgi:hypothetical protein